MLEPAILVLRFLISTDVYISANRGLRSWKKLKQVFLLTGRNSQSWFMPGRGWLGTDLPRLRPDVKTIRDPYSGEELMAFPAIHPQVAVIHALRADQDGNAQIGDNKGVDSELSLVADIVIITAEEVLPELNKADLVGPFIDAVVAAPYGALPTSCHPNYPLDGEALLRYTENVSDPVSFRAFLQSYLFS
jgi:glutaconate CoA-transferase subunit A